MSQPVGSLKDLQDLLDGVGSTYGQPRFFPFYSVLMYTPMNGLNEVLHKYIAGRRNTATNSFIPGHFELFSKQTGPNWLVAIVEDINRGQEIERFSAGAVYDIARYLGARVDDLPAIVFFTEPKDRNETLVLKLAEVLPAAEGIKDENITKFIGTTAAIIDRLWDRHGSSDARLDLLRDELTKALRPIASTAEQKHSHFGWLKLSFANAPTVLGAITSIVNLIKALGLY